METARFPMGLFLRQGGFYYPFQARDKRYSAPFGAQHRPFLLVPRVREGAIRMIVVRINSILLFTLVILKTFQFMNGLLEARLAPDLLLPRAIIDAGRCLLGVG
jgi:hypothetical protein